MTRKDFIGLMAEQYGAEPDYPWDEYENAVFRHKASKKWFALLMRIPAEKLGLEEDTLLDVVNLKIDRDIRFELHQEDGIYPAYHMSKVHWITVDLREMTEAMIIKLVDMSYELTMQRADKAK